MHMENNISLSFREVHFKFDHIFFLTSIFFFGYIVRILIITYPKRYEFQKPQNSFLFNLNHIPYLYVRYYLHNASIKDSMLIKWQLCSNQRQLSFIMVISRITLRLLTLSSYQDYRLSPIYISYVGVKLRVWHDSLYWISLIGD